jgi:hypothetical protein
MEREEGGGMGEQWETSGELGTEGDHRPVVVLWVVGLLVPHKGEKGRGREQVEGWLSSSSATFSNVFVAER